MSLVNPSFEDASLAGWAVEGKGGRTLLTAAVTSEAGYVDSGAYAAKLGPSVGGPCGAALLNSWSPLIKPNSTVTASARVRSQGGVKGNAFAWVGIRYVLSGNQVTETFSRMLATNEMRNGFTTLSVSSRAPQGAISAQMVLLAETDAGGRTVYFDSCTMSVTEVSEDDVSLTFPVDGSVYQEGDSVPFRVNILAGLPTTSVKYVVTNTTTSNSQEYVVTGAPWSYDLNTLVPGSYSVKAEVSFGSSSTVTTNTNTFTIGDPPPPDTREYKASNAYAYLVASNISGLSAAVPPTARITGLEILVDYKLAMLIRSKEKGIDDPASARYSMAFNMAQALEFTTTMLSAENGTYREIGSTASAQHSLVLSDFSVVEDGTTEGFRWTVLEGDEESILVGSSTSVFGLDNITVASLPDLAIGIKATPVLGTKPSYADSGDAAIRVMMNKMRVRIYFDAGSVEYYFASPDKSQIIKGTLVAANTLGGNLASGDASGMLQLRSDLEVMDGTQEWIGNDWTIHAAYPPTDANQIGDVADIEGEAEVGMRYNGLPTQDQVRTNRSRYQFITANFYGDKSLNSIYGANGYGRAFAHNGEWFYKIYTQPSEEKDKPRHAAYNHWHLALGYDEGRVDISVVGEPYNYDGALGASSWTIGDQVVGLLPLSGTILGVFGAKSVWGISGTTVDNFATQLISPNIGATEYTICDMGFPVYANAYGIYTLSQTQQYGDYLGTPMSQDVSPWLRPRLVRKYTTDREVEVAWPVRSKNQYRLAFSDGYVLSMTMNGQAVPTFSRQKYFLGTEGYEGSMYEQRSIVPAAVSSQLDVTGEERIHIAPYVEEEEQETPEMCISLLINSAMGTINFPVSSFSEVPEWCDLTEGATFAIDYFDVGDWMSTFEVIGGGMVQQTGGMPLYGGGPARGSLRQETPEGTRAVCLNWEVRAPL